MLQKLKALEEKFEHVSALMADPVVAADPAKFREHARTYAELEPLIQKYREYEKTKAERDQAGALAREAADEERRTLGRDEESGLEGRLAELEAELTQLLLPKDTNDEKNVILEIRAGTGGDEATLFAQEFYRMYSRYAEQRGWKMEVMSGHSTGVGG